MLSEDAQEHGKHAFRVRLDDEFLTLDPTDRLHDTEMGIDVKRVMAVSPTLSTHVTAWELAMFSV